MRWHHNSYSEEALAEMQKEAENRVRQMQSRARLVGDYSPPEKQPENERQKQRRSAVIFVILILGNLLFGKILFINVLYHKIRNINPGFV